MFQLVDDNGLIINALLWLFVLSFLLLLSVTLIQFIQLCFTCHRFCSRTIYQPVGKVYLAYKSFMQIDPLPADIIQV
uniref:Envelope small membrane protein n=2 Tax=Coronaviridae TaxID=11118 RepID=F1DAY5_9ALPC|nr:envelope protein [Chaerephon bat coronavirus/Kenya/KY41/2006]